MMTEIKETKNAYGLGRRKTAIAKVWLLTEKTTKEINGQPYAKYFNTPQQRAVCLQALRLTSQEEKFGVKANVTGGGKAAQAEAVRLGVARALLELDPAWRKQLKDAGLMTRDPRAKERKKYGLKRARRAPQFSKR